MGHDAGKVLAGFLDNLAGEVGEQVSDELPCIQRPWPDPVSTSG